MIQLDCLNHPASLRKFARKGQQYEPPRRMSRRLSPPSVFAQGYLSLSSRSGIPSCVFYNYSFDSTPKPCISSVEGKRNSTTSVFNLHMRGRTSGSRFDTERTILTQARRFLR